MKYWHFEREQLNSRLEVGGRMDERTSVAGQDPLEACLRVCAYKIHSETG